ncbi:hypothetical protein B5808_08520 [Cnuibacter physcomitrellae]|uniref:MmyB-like transcription regulator ligand binding domain-containing protein n=1 Tax=Cnuibacter physcomitrellae TaxID=1619308 RepID=A0A1X9LMT6_9MICO|nr:hypothetical protein [Cnuibacter physcomitrellae]ARJ05251.1 hypothetical protein B5808_08520 [Cnuibacter physcomitrellae]MCS5498568.1 hypothetical protein [Cnuibacter physcomitrellae]
MDASAGSPQRRARQGRALAFWETVPTILVDHRLDVLDSNVLAQALSEAFRPGENLALFSFLSPDRDASDPRWKEMSAVVAGLLRESLDERDEDRGSQRIVGELSSKSRDFAEVWASPETVARTRGDIAFEGTRAGDLRMSYQMLSVLDQDDSALMVFVPSDEASRTALDRLRSDLAVNAVAAP